MVETIEVEANYDRPKQVPVIGQRKRMRVNGLVQTMTLNQIHIERMHGWDDDGVSHVWWYNAKEQWGGFYDNVK